MGLKFVFFVVGILNRIQSSGSVLVQQVPEGAKVSLKCSVPDPGPTVDWFRVLESSGGEVDFIVSIFLMNPREKRRGPSMDSFSLEDINSHVLILKSFTKSDSGLYSCVSFKKDVKFGAVTRLQLVPQVEAAHTTVKGTSRNGPAPCTNPAPCKNPAHSAPVALQCSVQILAPVVGGCAVLLLLLLCTVLYCNSLRSRRCPHHYRRKLQKATPGRPLKTDSRA